MNCFLSESSPWVWLYPANICSFAGPGTSASHRGAKPETDQLLCAGLWIHERTAVEGGHLSLGLLHVWVSSDDEVTLREEKRAVYHC